MIFHKAITFYKDDGTEHIIYCTYILHIYSQAYLTSVRFSGTVTSSVITSVLKDRTGLVAVLHGGPCI